MNLHKRIPVICMLLISFLISTIAVAQNDPGNRAKNRTKWKINRKADEKVDNTVDDAFNAVGNLFKKKNKNKNKGGEATEEENTEYSEEVSVENTENGVIIRDGSEDVSISFEEEEDFEVTPSEFIGSFRMTVASTKNGKPQKNGNVAIDYFIDEYRFAFQMNPEQTKENPVTMIYDLKTRKITTLTTDKGKKQGTVLPMPKLAANVDTEDVTGEDISITKTSETKTIEGYPCVKYLFDSEEMEGEMWMTEDVVVDMSFMSNMVKMKKKGNDAYTMKDWYGVSGTALESHMTNKKDGETFDSYLTNIETGSVDQAVFSTEGYQVMDLSKFLGK